MDYIEDVISCYEDLITMFDSYFNSSLLDVVKNDIYKHIVNKVKDKANFLMNNNLTLRGIRYTSRDNLCLKIMKINMESLFKVKK
jgi:hypothetical protein